jgi:hypothetical protein
VTAGPGDAVQLDLFGEVPAAEDKQQRKADELAAWQAQFERAPWVAPYDTAGGMKAGESTLGWRCPDPDCGVVEVNGSHLMINQGWAPNQVGHAPYDGRCHRLRSPARQADAAAERERQVSGGEQP